MTTSIVLCGADTYSNADKPSQPHDEGTQLRLKDGVKQVYIRGKSPVPAGANIVSALLYIRSHAAAAGVHNLDLQRLSEGWAAKNVTDNNKPSATGAAVTSSATGPVADHWWAWDVKDHLNLWQGGAKNYGWRIVSDSATELILRSGQAGSDQPYLVVVWNTAPAAPTILVPSTGSVSVSHPVVSCDYSDASGESELASVQVQINATDSWGAPTFDSGEVAAEEPALDLAATAFAGLADTDSLFWRIRVKSADDDWSEWSDAAVLARDDLSAVTITNPAVAPNNFVQEYTPPFGWTFPGTQTHYRVIVTLQGNPGAVVVDSRRQQSAATAWTIPSSLSSTALAEAGAYTVEVRVWDDKIREATPGAPVYATASRDFDVQYDAGAGAVSSIAVAQVGVAPWVDVEFVDATAADSYTLMRDGAPVAADLLPGDLLVSGTTYRIRDYSAAPERTHTWKVRREVNGKLSNTAPSATLTTQPESVWLYDPESGDSVRLGGLDVGIEAPDDAEEFSPLGARGVIRSVSSVNGLRGSAKDLLIRDRPEHTWQEAEDLLMAWKSRPAATFRLVYGAVTLPVWLGDIAIGLHPVHIKGQVAKAVSFRFWQNGEYGFQVRP